MSVETSITVNEEVSSHLETSVPRKDYSLSKLKYDAQTIWLFTFSDLKTIVIPKTAFATLGALSGPISILTPTPPTPLEILSRIPLVFLWVWLNLLPFAINNQRQPPAISEDSINKPWRPLPSKRCTPTEARNIMFVAYPLALVLSYYTGAVWQCVGLMVLGYWYNDCGGADNGWLVRNGINGAGYICFASGALNTMLTYTNASTSAVLTTQAWRWLFILGAIVCSTVQLQDLYDQAGDGLRGRRTMPLVLGDSVTRWVLSGFMALWSCWCPWYWGVGWLWYAPTLVTGAVVVGRVLLKRSVAEDKTTFKIWNAWVVFLYAFPLIRRLT